MSNHVDNLTLGQIGENLVCDFLLRKKYRIIERNFREKFGEIDIIARSPQKVLVLVEVKTLIADNAAGLAPEDNMTGAKIKKFRKISEFYVAKNTDQVDRNGGWQMDVIAVEFPRGTGECNSKNFQPIIRHYENI